MADPEPQRAAARRYYWRNRTAFRDKLLLRTHGINPEQYESLLAQQDGRCAICAELSERPLRVDHNHRTGTVRGLLCDRCNRLVLGGSRERLDVLENAISYLKRDREREVLMA